MNMYEAIEIEKIPAPEPLRKTLLEIGTNECRWPVSGDRADTRFCCREMRFGSSYCEFHYRLSRGIGTASERAADKVRVAE